MLVSHLRTALILLFTLMNSIIFILLAFTVLLGYDSHVDFPLVALLTRLQLERYQIFILKQRSRNTIYFIWYYRDNILSFLVKSRALLVFQSARPQILSFLLGKSLPTMRLLNLSPLFRLNFLNLYLKY